MKQPKQVVEIKLNQILARKPHLINHKNRNLSHPFFKKFSHIPFNDF